MDDVANGASAVRAPVRVTNASGAGRYIIVCEHASNAIPEEYGTLGLDADQLTRHIAWDPGALDVATELARHLDAPLVESTVSRLVIDCNRPLDAPDLIAQISETTEVPGNRELGSDERRRRIALSHEPFHAAIDELVQRRSQSDPDCAIVTVHSFTPVYNGVERPWHVGIIHDDDERLSAPLIARLQDLDWFVIGDNQPYAPSDRVYYTLERHARPRGLPCAMVEIRNDLLQTPDACGVWASVLSGALSALSKVRELPHVHS